MTFLPAEAEDMEATNMFLLELSSWFDCQLATVRKHADSTLSENMAIALQLFVVGGRAISSVPRLQQQL